MRIYDAEIKLRSLLYTYIFIALTMPEEIRFSKETKIIEQPKQKRKTYSAKIPEKLVRAPRHYKTFYEDYTSKSPVRPITGKQRFKIFISSYWASN